MPKPRIDLAAAVHGAAKPAAAEAATPLPPPARPAARSRRGTKGVVIHVQPALWRRLRQLALDEETSVQALGVEAFTRLLEARRTDPA